MSSTIVKPTDWTLCALCQEHSTKQSLRDKQQCKNQSCQEAYKTLAQNLKALSDLNALPFGINLSRLDDGCGIAETLAKHDAKWHKNCFVQCSNSRVARAESRARKRNADQAIPLTPVKKKLRSSFTSPPVGQNTTIICFFCDSIIDDGDVVHRAATKNLDSNGAVSGCDTVSSIAGIGKKTVWDIWNLMRNLGKVFYRLSHAPAEVTNDDMDEIERFFVVLYKRTSPLKKVNEARKQLFAHGNRKVENIPPTKEALRQHVKRAVFQAGHIWGQSQIAKPEIPSPADWGWVKSEDNGWCPFWTVMPEASKECRELIKCMCKKRCAGNCKCFAANLPCTELCFCSGQCFQEEQSND